MTTRRSGDETRALLLDIGVRMVMQRGVTAGVQHIRLQEVLRTAGLTTGAAYRLWADQTAYQRDLALELVRQRLSPPIEHQVAALAALPPDHSMDDVIRTAGASHVSSLSGDDDRADSKLFLIALALRAAAGDDGEMAAAARERHAESIREFTTLYSEIMRTYGVRMRSPYEVRDFAEAMAALGEGFALRHAQGMQHPIFTIEQGDEAPAGQWTLFGIGVRALVHAFMTPLDGDWD